MPLRAVFRDPRAVFRDPTIYRDNIYMEANIDGLGRNSGGGSYLRP